MVELRVKDRAGGECIIAAGAGTPLMEALRDANTGVLGTCGGACACGTCHVYVADRWTARLPGQGEDERMMLEAIGELVEVRPNSRLACQIPLTEALAGLEIEIGPVA